MGNKVGKELESKVPIKTTFKVDDKYLVIKDGKATETTNLIAKMPGMKGGINYYKILEDGTKEVLYKGKRVTLLKNISGLYSAEDTLILTIRGDNGFKVYQAFSYSTTPVFEGQEADDAGKANKDDPDLYVATVTKTTYNVSAAEATLYLVEGYDNDNKQEEFKLKPVVKATKLSSMTLHAYVENMEGVCVARCKHAGGISTVIEYEIAEGMYIPAVIQVCAGLTRGGSIAAW